MGQPPLASELWNTRSPTTPKAEGDLSNWLAPRLEGELGSSFDVARERLVSGGGVGRGKSADIQVVCLSPSAEKLHVLVEVKGCWEPKLMTKLESQLSDDYMTTTGSTAGAYVVFSFDAENWDQSDDRQKRSTFASAEEARQALEPLAAKVAADHEAQVEVVVLDASLI